jgi:threonine/homoserine/homoserine lactone efflux protein
MSPSEIAAFSAFAWISSFTPGPNVAIATATGVNYGVRAVLPQVAGVSIGFFMMLWVVGFGGASVIHTNLTLLLLVKWVGVSYLLYLGWKLTRVSRLSDSANGIAFNVQQAALFQMVNPKAWMMMVASTSTYVIGHPDMLARMWMVSLGFVVPSALSILCWAWAGDRLRAWLQVGQRLLMFNRVMGAALIVTAVWMLFV